MPEFALTSATMKSCEKIFPVTDYDLGATLASGQAFRWLPRENSWVGVVCGRWVQLESVNGSIIARAVGTGENWSWLMDYLQIETDLNPILAGFPNDDVMRSAIAACHGLRLLRQNPWECLASFILSSTKQIVQIQQIIALLCQRFGEPLAVLPGHAPAHAFPAPERLATANESELRNCKMGFRAPYLLAAARSVADGRLDLAGLARLPVADARNELLALPGVGPKIADCVLLFAYDFPSAFPVDVWVMKALRQLYFPRRKPSRSRLQRFTETYFGRHPGYAQQYLFHYMRTRHSKLAPPVSTVPRASQSALLKPASPRQSLKSC
jgi:N-glycosylase/DNA lyase